MISASFRRRARRGEFDLWDLIIFLFMLGLLAAILLPSLSRARTLAKRSVCTSNLRGIAQGLHIYANDNRESFPIHYFEAKKEQTGTPRETGVRWVGTQGSNDFLKISQQTSPQVSPDRSHPSRSLFMLIIGGQATPSQFVCPDSKGEIEDALRNFGPDARDGLVQAAQPGLNRFDFPGYESLSYGYQLPYSNRGRPSTKLDVRMPLAADKGPYYKSGGAGLEGTKTTRDARSDRQPPSDWAQGLPNAEVTDRVIEQAILKRGNDEWRPYNSRNHATEGQNILFLDGHVDFSRKPIAGVHHDNLYTLTSSVTSPAGCWIGVVPAADQALGPSTHTDSFIVP